MDFAHAHFFAAAWRNKSRATLRKNLLESRNYFLLTQRRETELLLEAKKRVWLDTLLSKKSTTAFVVTIGGRITC